MHKMVCKFQNYPKQQLLHSKSRAHNIYPRFKVFLSKIRQLKSVNQSSALRLRTTDIQLSCSKIVAQSDWR